MDTPSISINGGHDRLQWSIHYDNEAFDTYAGVLGVIFIFPFTSDRAYVFPVVLVVNDNNNKIYFQ